MPDIRQLPSRNYFVSVDFFLRTALFVIAITIIILQHALSYCKTQYPSSDLFIYEYFTPSFGTNSWSATGLYVTCWAMIVLYIHTVLLVFMDKFQIQYHAATYVIQDIITSIFFLTWTTMNILQLSDCSKRQLAFDRNETQQRFENPFCESTPCSVYLAPSIGCFIAMFIAISLAASAFRKINFYKLPRFIRDQDSIRSSTISLLQPIIPSIENNNINKQFYPLPNAEIVNGQRSTEMHSNRS